MLVIQTEAALSIGAFADNNMADRIRDLRSSIFVETAFLEADDPTHLFHPTRSLDYWINV